MKIAAAILVVFAWVALDAYERRSDSERIELAVSAWSEYVEMRGVERGIYATCELSERARAKFIDALNDRRQAKRALDDADYEQARALLASERISLMLVAIGSCQDDE